EIIRGAGGERMGRWHSRVRGLPEYGGELPVAALAEEIETPGEGQVRALVTQSGNPVLSSPNGARLERALATLAHYVAIDFYLNETTRHAHVILPPTGPLEREHYDLVFNALAVRNVAKYSPALRKRDRDARHDWEILGQLTERITLGRRSRWQGRVMRTLGPRRLLDLALRTGAYGAGIVARGKGGLTVKALEQAPHGVDLGPLRPAFPERLRTAGKRVVLAPAPLVADVARLAAWLAEHDAARAVMPDALALIGRRALRSNNSWMHNSARLVRGRDGCTLHMHPHDATARGLADGERVTVTSRTGSVTVAVEVTEAIMPGVVSLPHGWGHTRAGTRQEVAAAHAGASINDLTDEQRIDALCGNAAFSGTPVRVARA
nr:molybdopterin-dependent oxidoreductase [Gemmatimonadaceae bacterium]